VLGIATLLSLRFRIGPLALVALFAIGVELRFANFGVGYSDVDDVLRAGLDQLVHGVNPYLASIAPGATPFPYGPIALIWYLPLHDPRLQEFGISIVLLALLAFRGRPMGLALWATAPLAVQLASDGSNDHTAAALLLISLLVLQRWPRAGALLIGIGAGFKVYALAWLPPVFFWAGAGPFVIGLVGAIGIWLPAALLWGANNVIATFQAADAVHRTAYYSLGEALARAHLVIARTTLDTFRLVAGAATALATSPFVRTFPGVVITGAAIYLVTLYTGFWSTGAYLIPILLLIAWFLDDWIGPTDGRVAWPSDPVGLITESVDRRWPTVDATRIGRP
jgi:hypothetical protein